LRTKTSTAKSLAQQLQGVSLQAKSSETPEDGDMSMKTWSQLPTKELERRQCRETNVLINYHQEK